MCRRRIPWSRQTQALRHIRGFHRAAGTSPTRSRGTSRGTADTGTPVERIVALPSPTVLWKSPMLRQNRDGVSNSVAMAEHQMTAPVLEGVSPFVLANDVTVQRRPSLAWGRLSARLTAGRLRCGPSEPQPKTVSHDGGSAGRPGARMPRCTPTGLSHAANVGCLSGVSEACGVAVVDSDQVVAGNGAAGAKGAAQIHLRRPDL